MVNFEDCEKADGGGTQGFIFYFKFNEFFGLVSLLVQYITDIDPMYLCNTSFDH